MPCKGQIVFSVNPRPWKRARTRIPTSCGPCRRRKSRCDKGKPCGACLKSKTAKFCNYEEDYEQRNGNVDSLGRPHGLSIGSESTISSATEFQFSPPGITFNDIKKAGGGDQQGDDNFSNFVNRVPSLLKVDGNNNTRDNIVDQATTNMSALSLIAIQAEDHQREVATLRAQIESLKQTVQLQKQSLAELSQQKQQQCKCHKRKVREFSGYMVKDSKLTFYGPTSYMSLIMDDKYTCDILAEYLKRQLESYEEFSEVQLTEHCDVTSSNQATNKNSNADVTASVTNDLPSLSIVKVLVERFFKYCYPFAPFIEKRAFMKELDLAIKDNGEHAKLSFESKRYNAIAILLVMLRFAYLTIPFKEYSKGNLSKQDNKLVELFKDSNLTISPTYVDVAYRLIMSSLTGLRRVNLPFIQGLLLIRIYKMYCPEDDDNMQDTGLLQSLIVQLCRQRGINKDPSGCPENIMDANKVYIWQKLWTMVKFTDATYAFNSGGMTLTGIEGESDDELEKGDLFDRMGYDLSSVIDKPFITRKLCLIGRITKLIRRVTSEMYLKQFVCVKELVGTLDELKTILDNDLRSFEQLYNNVSYSMYQGSVAERVEEFLIRCDVTVEVFHLNMVVFQILDHDQKQELLGIYNKNTILGSALENFLTLMKISDKHASIQTQMFGAEYVSVMMSRVYKALQKMAGPTCTIIIRALEGVISINELATYFRSADLAGLASWVGLNWQDDSTSLFNLFQRVCQLSSRSQTFSKICLGAHRVHAILRSCVPYIKRRYPFLQEDSLSDTKTLSSNGLVENDDMQCTFGMEFTDVDELWNKRPIWDTSIDFDYLFSHLNDSGYDPMALESIFYQPVQ